MSGERLLDVCFALTVGGWAVAAWLHASPGDRVSPVLWLLLAMHVTVATLLLRRTPARSTAPRAILIACVPSLLTAGVAWKLAPAPAEWPPWAAATFVVGGVFACTSLLSLGRSFAVLPAVRSVVSRGPYRIVRHPAYAGELLMFAACIAAAGNVVVALWFVPLTCALLALRIVAEERHLTSTPDYRAYASRVRHRLVPFVW